MMTLGKMTLLILTAMLCPPQTAYAQTGEPARFLTLVSAYRQQNGVGSVTVDSRLQVAAEAMAADLVASHQCEHVDSAGRDLGTRLRAAGWPYAAGENLACASGEGLLSAEAALGAWVGSPPHNANMLNSAWTVMGVARACTFDAAGAATWCVWALELGAFPSSVPATPLPPTATSVLLAPTATPVPRPPTTTPTATPKKGWATVTAAGPAPTPVVPGLPVWSMFTSGLFVLSWFTVRRWRR